MNDVVMNESLIFDACALLEEVSGMSNVSSIKQNIEQAARLLNQALDNSEKVR